MKAKDQEFTARWMFTLGLFVLLVCVFFLSAAMYLVFVGLLLFVGLMVGSAMLVHKMTDSGNVADAMLGSHVASGVAQGVLLLLRAVLLGL